MELIVPTCTYVDKVGTYTYLACRETLSQLSEPDNALILAYNCYRFRFVVFFAHV